MRSYLANLPVEILNRIVTHNGLRSGIHYLDNKSYTKLRMTCKLLMQVFRPIKTYNFVDYKKIINTNPTNRIYLKHTAVNKTSVRFLIANNHYDELLRVLTYSQLCNFTIDFKRKILVYGLRINSKTFIISIVDKCINDLREIADRSVMKFYNIEYIVDLFLRLNIYNANEIFDKYIKVIKIEIFTYLLDNGLVCNYNRLIALLNSSRKNYYISTFLAKSRCIISKEFIQYCMIMSTYSTPIINHLIANCPSFSIKDYNYIKKQHPKKIAYVLDLDTYTFREPNNKKGDLFYYDKINRGKRAKYFSTKNVYNYSLNAVDYRLYNYYKIDI